MVGAIAALAVMPFPVAPEAVEWNRHREIPRCIEVRRRNRQNLQILAELSREWYSLGGNRGLSTALHRLQLANDIK